MSPELTPDQEAPKVFQLGYASAASYPFSDDELIELLAKARTKNTTLGVTGMLLYIDGSFLQILEGDRAAVEHLYDRIRQDDRHTDAMLLFRLEDQERQFDEWTMGFQSFRSWAAAPAGLNRFLSTGVAAMTEADGERIREVLLGFREGRWRRVVDH